jgi:hypothetical protein
MPKQKAPRRAPARERGTWTSVAAGTDRIEVPGGWIYRTVKRGAGMATCFVPRQGGADPQQVNALHRAARELKQKLEQLRGLLDQLSAARRLKSAPVRGTKVH